MGCKHDMHWCVGICDKDNGLCRMCQIDMQAELERLKAERLKLENDLAYRRRQGDERLKVEVDQLQAEVERYKRYWTSPQKVFDKNKKLRAEVVAWQEYATSHGCTCVDSEWYDPDGNAIVRGSDG